MRVEYGVRGISSLLKVSFIEQASVRITIFLLNFPTLPDSVPLHFNLWETPYTHFMSMQNLPLSEGKLVDSTTIIYPQNPKLKIHKNSFPWTWHISFPFIVVFSLHIIMVSLNFPWQGAIHPFRLHLRCVWAANSALLVSFYQHAKRNNLKLCYTTFHLNLSLLYEQFLWLPTRYTIF